MTFEICERCGDTFEVPQDALDPAEKLCEDCKRLVEGDPQHKVNLRLDGGGKLEVTGIEARRMLRFQQLIDSGYGPKEAFAKVESELGAFEK